jgi:hypothetical protein
MSIKDPHQPVGSHDEADESGTGADRTPALGAPLEPEPARKPEDAGVAQHEFDHALRTAFTKP